MNTVHHSTPTASRRGHCGSCSSGAHQGEEGAEHGDGAEVGDVGVHVGVLLLGEQGVVTLDPAPLHVLVPAGNNVRLHQRSLALAGRVELQLLPLVLRGAGGEGVLTTGAE